MLANPQKLRPIFTQEQLATSLRATQLCDVVMHAAALVDSSVPSSISRLSYPSISSLVGNSTSVSRGVPPRAFHCPILVSY